MRDAPRGGVFGFFCLLAAVSLAAQAVYTYRRGYMYLGRTQKVYRTERPTAFRVAVLVHLGLVAVFAAFAVSNLVHGTP